MPRKAKRKSKPTQLAKRGNAVGMAKIRIMCNAIETRMIERYVGNAPTLRNITAITKMTLREITGIKPAMMSDCDSGWIHRKPCLCVWAP